MYVMGIVVAFVGGIGVLVRPFDRSSCIRESLLQARPGSGVRVHCVATVTVTTR
jgi:hypothetical protein